MTLREELVSYPKVNQYEFEIGWSMITDKTVKCVQINCVKNLKTAKSPKQRLFSKQLKP